MYKLLKLLGVVAVIASASGHAYASTLQEDFVFSWSTNGSFTLADLSYSSPTSGNLLTGPFTTATGGSVPAGSGTFSDLVSVDTTQHYTSDYTISNFTGNVSTFSISVSPVPLPASFPLFAMALLLGLGLMGYHSVRSKGGLFGLNRQLESAL
jgi:hypothetical protein